MKRLAAQPGAAPPRVPLAGRATRPVGARSTRRARGLTPERFVGAILAVCLLLQRFAVPFGSLELSVAAPLGLLLAVWGLAAGILTLDRRRAACFLGLCAMALVATAMHVNVPVAIAPRISLNSLAYWLVITAFAILRLREPMPEAQFFRLVSTWLTVVAAAGVLAFIGQFVGLTLFSFSHLVPARLLIEDQYAVVIPLKGSGILRANGFFLVEPSVFSQFMAVGIIIEWLTFRRPPRMLLYVAALLMAVSGTGWLVLTAFLLSFLPTLSLRRLLQVFGLLLVCAAAIVAASFILPTITADLFDRTGELSQPGSSGYARFVTPFMALGHVLHDAPWTLVTGLGPGASQDLLLPFKYTLNTPVKIVMEYGVFGLSMYLGVILMARRSARQRALLVPLMVLLMFTGGYQEFPPILLPVLLIATVAVLREGGTPRQAPSARGAPARVPP